MEVDAECRITAEFAKFAEHEALLLRGGLGRGGGFSRGVPFVPQRGEGALYYYYYHHHLDDGWPVRKDSFRRFLL